MQAVNHSFSQPPLVVTTATSMEMRAACLDLNVSIPEEGGHVATGVYDTALLLLVTGVGPINAAMALAHVQGSLPRLRGVLNLGVAGAFDLRDLPLCSPVVVKEEIWPEYGLVTEQGVDPKGIGLAMGRLRDNPVWDRLTLTPEENARDMGLVLPDMPQTVSLTVAGVTGSARRAQALRHTYGADLENMEGFALAWTCSRLDIPFLEVRTVSNLVGSRLPEHWELQKALQGLGEVFSSLLGSELNS